MQQKRLRSKLIVIISTIFVLPYLVLCYIFYEQQVTLSPIHFVLFFLILTLVVFGIILVCYVFDAVSTTAEFFKKATEGSKNLSLSLHQDVAELDEISSSFNGLMERLDETTESLNQTLKALHESEEKYRNILENIGEGYYEVDLTGNFTFYNTSMSQILGYSKEEMKGMNNCQYMDKENAKKAFLAYNEIYRTGIPKMNLDGELIRKDGKKVFLEASVSLIKDTFGQSVGFRGIVHDITERKRMEEEIFTISITDHLTGLYNRRGFMTLADQQLKINERTKTGLLLLFADLDNTKAINDNLGHEIGDEAIAEVAAILKEVFRKSDIVARMGGDEFAVLGIESTTQYVDILEHRLQHQIDIHNAIENKNYKISLSIGMAYSDPENPSSIDELISKADKLMYEQKRSKQL